MRAMRVAAVPMQSAIGDVQGNLARLVALVGQAAQAGCDLLVLPEACLTGYSSARADEIAVDAGCEACRELERAAQGAGVAVCYGFVERNPQGRPFVTQVVCDGASALVYRKTHLGQREQEAFAAGDDLPVAQVAGACVGVHLCWESHLPQVAATLRAKGAELLLVPYASGCTGQRRAQTWNRYLPARAYDNGAFVVAVNSVRERADGTLCGGGVMVCAPDGQVLAEDYGLGGRMLTVDLDGLLPRDNPDGGMRAASWFAARRPDLYL